MRNALKEHSHQSGLSPQLCLRSVWPHKSLSQLLHAEGRCLTIPIMLEHPGLMYHLQCSFFVPSPCPRYGLPLQSWGNDAPATIIVVALNGNICWAVQLNPTGDDFCRCSILRRQPARLLLLCGAVFHSRSFLEICPNALFTSLHHNVFFALVFCSVNVYSAIFFASPLSTTSLKTSSVTSRSA